MATIPASALAKGRQFIAKLFGTVDYDKSVPDAVFQAVEDWFEANRGNLSTTIDTAASPTVFTATQKKRIIAAYLEWKMAQELQ